jgi:hypothetical protein
MLTGAQLTCFVYTGHFVRLTGDPGAMDQCFNSGGPIPRFGGCMREPMLISGSKHYRSIGSVEKPLSQPLSMF